MVELLLLLMIASLVVAAMVPVITKKHLMMPAITTHGTYMCYYKDNYLVEERWAGKLAQKLVFRNGDTAGNRISTCIFDPPKKATYFQVTAIGGGGGGGDAGYMGGYLEEELGGVDAFSPLGVTEDTLKDRRIDKNEFLDHAGYIYGFAKSYGSGNS